MKRLAASCALLMLLAGCDQPAAEPPEVQETEADSSACHREIFEKTPLTVCTADPQRHRIRMVLATAGGVAYRSLATYAATRPADAKAIAFAMNGGMFDEEGQPIGYYVENGKRLQTLNQAEGPGNFHLLPNGVFYVDSGQWTIRTSADFAENVTERPDYATQSGPMLVIDGELHPGIAEDGESRFIRNAVGIDGEGRAHFVISEAPISFGKLARFYRDQLAVPRALYLDGNVSALWNPATGRLDTAAQLGPLIVVEKQAKAAR